MEMEMVFDGREETIIYCDAGRERINDSEFVRLLQQIDELSAWFRAHQQHASERTRRLS